VSEDETRKDMQEEDQDEVEGHRRGGSTMGATDDTTESEGGDDEVEAHLRKGISKKF
jgi:hypothetical protein